MRISRCGYAVLLTLMLAAGPLASDDHQAPETTELSFLTEHFPPLSMREGDRVTGQAVELVRALMRATGTSGEIEVLEWSDALARSQNQANTVLFSTVLTPERKDAFQWVGPTAVLHTGLYARAEHPIVINTLDQARAAEGIATIADYYSEQLLKAEGGFDNLRQHAGEEEAARALLAGEVELMIADNATLPQVLDAIGAERSAVRRVFSVATDLTYLAFTPDVPAATIERWQAALDAMKADGRFDALYQQWLPSEIPPGRLYLVTEEYPPITFMREGTPAGFVTDMVRAIAGDLGFEDAVHLTSWKNAYNLAQLHPNVVLFSAERTPAREDLFHWIGPVGRNAAILYSRAGNEVAIESLEGARAVPTIATTTDWFTEQFLEARGFDNLEGSPDPADSVRRLMAGEATLAIFTDITVPEIVARAGFTLDDLQPQLVVSQTDFYIALSRGTDPARVAQWRQALERLKADGRFESIYRRYLPNARLEDLLGQ
ncbi:MAG: transporter substrate-binding domain-containing protein [Wenzhouxiangellaceae bacterium]|nr:transporter substrate-binding domain-containing protein [Wenzhouxiangellaceae bacterium]